MAHVPECPCLQFPSCLFDSITKKEEFMAKRTVLVSDLSGKEIPEREAAKLTITYSDLRRGQVVLDVLASEVEDLANKGTRQARRGRRPKQPQS
jgi:hypothetical protein